MTTSKAAVKFSVDAKGSNPCLSIAFEAGWLARTATGFGRLVGAMIEMQTPANEEWVVGSGSGLINAGRGQFIYTICIESFTGKASEATRARKFLSDVAAHFADVYFDGTSIRRDSRTLALVP